MDCSVRIYRIPYLVLLWPLQLQFLQLLPHFDFGKLPQIGSTRCLPKNQFNTSYLTDSYIGFTLKLESWQKFCFNRSIKTYGKKIFLKFLRAGAVFF